MHASNLKRLADYLDLVPPASFDMSLYYSGDDPSIPAHEAECGTVACALGYGPAAGIEPGLSWHDRLLRHPHRPLPAVQRHLLWHPSVRTRSARPCQDA